MTEKQIRQNTVNTAKTYLGYKESNGSHKKIIDIYNKQTPLPVGYKVRYTDAWCATFISTVGIMSGHKDIMFPECSCNRMVKLYEKAGRWEEADNFVPSLGDIVMYDWQDSGAGDNAGYPDHVGMVVEVNGNDMKIIEGNYQNSVGYRDLKVDGKYIRGYCLPDYASKADDEDEPDTNTAEEKKPAEVEIEAAMKFSENYGNGGKGKTYTVTADDLHMRTGAGTSKDSIKILPKGSKVVCYGYYNKSGSSVWLLVVDEAGEKGYCAKKYLQ